MKQQLAWSSRVMAWGLVAMTTAACGSSVDLGGGAGGTTQGGSGHYDESGTSGTSGTSNGPEEFDPDYPLGETCPAACEDAAGSVKSLSSVQEFYTSLVGRWTICTGGLRAFGGAPTDVIGVEYAPPELIDVQVGEKILRGTMYYLVAGTDGPERGAGFAYQLTYDVSPQDDAFGPPSQLNMHPTPNSGFGGAFRYSPCPRQWELDGGSAKPSAKAILVPLD